METNERVRMPPPLSYGLYKKENCWICWLENEKGEVYSIEVYETSSENPGRVYRYLEHRLGKKAYLDIGNCLSDWNEWTLQDIFHKIGFLLKWESHDVKIRFLHRLGEIEEFSKQIERYLRYHHPCYL